MGLDSHVVCSEPVNIAPSAPSDPVPLPDSGVVRAGSDRLTASDPLLQPQPVDDEQQL